MGAKSEKWLRIGVLKRLVTVLDWIAVIRMGLVVMATFGHPVKDQS
jgi:hypothetical protein